MKKLMLAAILVLSTSTFAETLTDAVHSIRRGKGNEAHIVRFMSGRVAFVEQDDDQKLAQLESLQRIKVEAVLDAKSTLQSMKSLGMLEISGINRLEAINQEFSPTVISSAQVQEIFNRMNSNIRRRSECSDRAHVWAYDEFQRSGIQAEKAFIFLTDSYIRRVGYKWWFHVAPAYTVGGEKMVLDHLFLDRPVTGTEWKNHLVFSKRDCVMDFSFNAYDAGADQTQDCYMKYVPMYYHFPGEIGSMEKGSSRTSFNEAEVNSNRIRTFNSGSF